MTDKLKSILISSKSNNLTVKYALDNMMRNIASTIQNTIYDLKKHNIKIDRKEVDILDEVQKLIECQKFKIQKSI